ncbi:MAG: initiator RepB protein [Marinobacter sp. T13-3]|nr:MAG: initiator RepB protein [Marinobacter sp. T13-3]
MEAATSGEQLDFVLLGDKAPSMKVVKSNALIEAHYDLSVKEHKLLSLAIARISRDQTAFTEQVFSVLEIAHLLGVSTKSIYGELDRVSDGLMRKQVQIRSHSKPEEFVKYQWVTRAWCKDGNFGIRISDDLAPYLLELTNEFTMYEVARILPMTSHYSVRLFELLRQYGSFGTRTFTLDPEATKEHNWPSFAAVMGYNPSSYPRFSNLNQRILKPAMKQVREYGQFRQLDVVQIKFGQKTIALRFTWQRDEEYEKLSGNPLFDKLIAFGVKVSVARNLFKTHGEDRIERNYLLACNAQKEGAIKENAAGYLVKAIDEDYAASLNFYAKDEAGEPKDVSPGASSPATASQSAPSATMADYPDHPVYSKCATEVEFQKLRAMERQRGKAFETYNEFHDLIVRTQFARR